MRLRAKVDRNQDEVVLALRNAGASVECLHRLGKGVPDLLVGYRGKNLVMEVKDGTLSPSRQALTFDEVFWHKCWRGQKAVVTSSEEALKLLQEV